MVEPVVREDRYGGTGFGIREFISERIFSLLVSPRLVFMGIGIL